MHVTLDSGKHYGAVEFRTAVLTFIVLQLLGFHEGSEIAHSSLHDSGRLDHLRQEHLAASEVITDDLHTVHEGALDHVQRSRESLSGLLSVLIDVVNDALDQGVLEPLVHGE